MRTVIGLNAQNESVVKGKIRSAISGVNSPNCEAERRMELIVDSSVADIISSGGFMTLQPAIVHTHPRQHRGMVFRTKIMLT